jgi:hypothetical protein
MGNLPRARFAAPLLHFCLSTVTWVLAGISTQPIFNGPARLPFAVLRSVDLSISANAFAVMLTPVNMTGSLRARGSPRNSLHTSPVTRGLAPHVILFI